MKVGLWFTALLLWVGDLVVIVMGDVSGWNACSLESPSHSYDARCTQGIIISRSQAFLYDEPNNKTLFIAPKNFFGKYVVALYDPYLGPNPRMSCKDVVHSLFCRYPEQRFHSGSAIRLMFEWKHRSRNRVYPGAGCTLVFPETGRSCFCVSLFIPVPVVACYPAPWQRFSLLSCLAGATVWT